MPPSAAMVRSRKLIRKRMMTMAKLAGKVGFASPIVEETLSRRRTTKIELIATLALAVSLMIAVRAVSIGVAHAEPIGAVKLIRL